MSLAGDHQLYRLLFVRENRQQSFGVILAGIFSAYGPPAKMQFGGDVEPGIASGAFRAMGYTLWAKGTDRVWMMSYFDWRLQQGNLYRQQPASVRFDILNPCNA